MKNFIRICLVSFCLFFWLWISQNHVHATAAVPIDQYMKEVTDISIWPVNKPPVEAVEAISKSILISIKTAISWLLLIYIVYAGIQMIMSLWTDEEQLTSAKNQIWYTVIAFAFINIPGAIFKAFDGNKQIGISGTSNGSYIGTPGSGENSIFINGWNLTQVLDGDIIGFMEIVIAGLAILIILIAGLKILTSRWNEEAVSEGKNRILWSWISLVWIGMIEIWKRIVFRADVSDGTTFFETLANLVLFFAGPTAMVFLTIAAYTYITANGDDDKIKRAKNIIINILFATVIVLASYTFLLDLITL